MDENSPHISSFLTTFLAIQLAVPFGCELENKQKPWKHAILKKHPTNFWALKTAQILNKMRILNIYVFFDAPWKFNDGLHKLCLLF